MTSSRRATASSQNPRARDDELQRSPRDFYKEQKEYEEDVLLRAMEQVKQIVKVDELNFEYKTRNNRTYSVVTLDKPLTTVEETLVKGQIDNNIYHIEISNNLDGKNIIEIHLKNILEKSLELKNDSEN